MKTGYVGEGNDYIITSLIVYGQDEKEMPEKRDVNPKFIFYDPLAVKIIKKAGATDHIVPNDCSGLSEMGGRLI